MIQNRKKPGSNRPAIAISILLAIYIVTGVLLCRFSGAALIDGPRLSPLGYFFYPVVKVYTAIRSL